MPIFPSKWNAATAKKQNVARKSWAASFPVEIESASHSTVFFARSIYVTFTHILASRRLMPQTLFKERIIDGNFRAYVMDKSKILGGRLIQKFKGVAEAIEQQYLRELMLIVSPTEDDYTDVIEMYTWRMRYDTDGEPQAELLSSDGTVMATLRSRGIQYLKKQTVKLLRTIRTICVDKLSPLPPGSSPAIRITYTDRLSGTGISPFPR
ncbi:hypothetical protein KIN20_025094 [Parelaphostrongylus tenuis]|uniref:HORMA domain-containing protein n=1 Tax=Parelaphostrongylus tenuis TaxID=148309 RepID=A0AAD5QU66_PARTN|nr:hypothetical protein KIN20_025094 [Parelaphostrongylus tenuis]